MINNNKKSVRELLTELEPGKHIAMYDPKDTSFLMTQCVRVGDIYYLTGPQFSVFTGQRLPVPPDLRTDGAWELKELFAAARTEGDTEAEVVELANDFLTAHGAAPDALVFICSNLTDVLATLAGLYATFKR